MGSYVSFDYDDDGYAIMKLNRPPVNSLSRELILNIDEGIKKLSSESQVKAILLRGEGKCFVAGADIHLLSDMNAEEGEEISRFGQEVFQRIAQLNKPVIAVIHGFAMGGGLELALACHLRLVANEAILGMPELKLGLIPGWGGTQRLAQLIGLSRAYGMILGDVRIDGIEAVKIGLCHASAPAEELVALSMSWAKRLARGSAPAMAAAIEALNQANSQQGYPNEALLFGQRFATEDMLEGVNAFKQKREPQFKERIL
jgi:enoyl-CoA hydratase